MYAIVKTGGKQYRVEQGQTLLVERLRAADGESVSLEPLLFVDGSEVVEGGDSVTVSARVVGHERGPKLRVVKFKPKRGYKRRTGHRQELTRIEVTEIRLGSGARSDRDAEEAPQPVAAGPVAAEPVAAEPVVAAAEPVVAAAEPEVAAAEPEVAAAEPEVAAAEPEVAAAEPEVAAAEPEVVEPTEEATDGS
jgi:large subunit ribosomal protein L21